MFTASNPVSYSPNITLLRAPYHLLPRTLLSCSLVISARYPSWSFHHKIPICFSFSLDGGDIDSTYQHLFVEMLKTQSSFPVRIPEQKEKPLSPPQSRRRNTRNFLCLGMLCGDSHPSRMEERMKITYQVVTQWCTETVCIEQPKYQGPGGKLSPLTCTFASRCLSTAVK